MATAYKASKGQPGPNTGSVNLPLPTGAAAGDFCIVAIGGNGSGQTYTLPAGFTAQTGTGDISTAAYAGVYEGTLTSTHITAGSLTFATVATTTQRINAAIATYTGLVSGDLNQVTPTFTTESATTANHTCPAITTTGVARIVRVVIDKANTTRSIVAPAGETLRIFSDPGAVAGACSVAISDNGADVAAGTQPTRTFTAKNAAGTDQTSNNARMWTLALAPAAGAAAPPSAIAYAAVRKYMNAKGVEASGATGITWTQTAGPTATLDLTDPFLPSFFRPDILTVGMSFSYTATTSGSGTVTGSVSFPADIEMVEQVMLADGTLI